MTEIANHVFGDVLTENPAVAQSAFGPHRVIPDRWKGMTPAQIEDVRRQQELQRQEKEVRNQFGFFIVIQIWDSCTSFIDQKYLFYKTCPKVFWPFPLIILNLCTKFCNRKEIGTKLRKYKYIVKISILFIHIIIHFIETLNAEIPSKIGSAYYVYLHHQ